MKICEKNIAKNILTDYEILIIKFYSSVPRGSCVTIIPGCEETGGICVSNNKKSIDCKCHNGTKFKPIAGCEGKSSYLML